MLNQIEHAPGTVRLRHNVLAFYPVNGEGIGGAMERARRNSPRGVPSIVMEADELIALGWMR